MNRDFLVISAAAALMSALSACNAGSQTHKIVWSFGGTSTAGPHTVVGVNDAQAVGCFILMAGTGVPANSPPFEPNCGIRPLYPAATLIRCRRERYVCATATRSSATNSTIASLR